MAKTNYSFGKRQRELEREKKKQDKEARKRDRAANGGNIPIATVEELQGGGNIINFTTSASIRHLLRKLYSSKRCRKLGISQASFRTHLD